jgi:hypothetical protein
MGGFAEFKKGAVADQGDFISMLNEYFTGLCKPLGSWANRLRKVVLPNSGRWEKESTELYVRIKTDIQQHVKIPRL